MKQSPKCPKTALVRPKHFLHSFQFASSSSKLSLQRHVNINTGLELAGEREGRVTFGREGGSSRSRPLAPPPPRGPPTPWIIDGAGSNNDVTTIAPLSVHRLAREISLPVCACPRRLLLVFGVVVSFVWKGNACARRVSWRWKKLTGRPHAKGCEG